MAAHPSGGPPDKLVWGRPVLGRPCRATLGCVPYCPGISTTGSTLAITGP
jgi:hypothetical protein